MKSLLAFTLGVTHPSGHMRIAAFVEALRLLGWQWRLHPFDADMGKWPPPPQNLWQRAVRRGQRDWRDWRAATVLRRWPVAQPILISRELPVPAGPFLECPNPLVLDMDDAIYLGPGRDQILALCQRAQVVVCGNEVIAADLAPFSRCCRVIPTVVDTDRYSVRGKHPAGSVLRIGWLGSSMSITETLLPLMEVLESIRRQQPFELVIIADELPPELRAVPWVRFIKWSPTVETAIAGHLDIGIMPLQDNPFQRAKCGAKLLQYMAAGLPVIASPIGINRHLVVDGVNGFWATSPADWQSAIERLAQSESLRMAFGQAGRAEVVRHYSVARWAPVWAESLNEL